MRNPRMFYAFLIMALLVSGCGKGKKKEPAALGPPEITAPTPALARPLTPEQREIKTILENNGGPKLGTSPTVLLVNKQNRRLTVYKGLTRLKSYPVVLGGNPRNDKLQQGDRCTPEGVYRVVSKFDHPKWEKFILLDYPNTQNWLKFNRAKQAGRIPHNAQIGGEIGIHGTDDPLKNVAGENWTMGCVSLLNQHIEEIYPLVNDKTLVVIKRH